LIRGADDTSCWPLQLLRVELIEAETAVLEDPYTTQDNSWW
jgi:hypothetical protein